jgi:hypothetical protein
MLHVTVHLVNLPLYVPSLEKNIRTIRSAHQFASDPVIEVSSLHTDTQNNAAEVAGLPHNTR